MFGHRSHQPGGPGASSDAYYEQARAAWRKRIAWRVALVAVAGSIAAGVMTLLPTVGPYLAGLVTGGLIVLLIGIWDEPPPFIERWRQGSEGERWTGKELKKLKSLGWVAEHDLASKYGNIDHIAVGPGGVFLIDSKNLWGHLMIEDGVLNVRFEASPRSDYTMPGLPKAVSSAAWGLERRLKSELGWVPDVQPVICVWGASFESGSASVGKAVIVKGEKLVDWLAERPERLCDADQLAVAEVLRGLPRASVEEPTPLAVRQVQTPG